MKVTEHLNKANGNTLFSIEILPPLKGEHIEAVFNNIQPLMEFKPPFINVTYHREEYIFKALSNGLHQKKIVRKRPGTVGICSAIQNKYNVDTIPHILCGGFTKEDTENFLIDLDFLGINNVMALRGDPVKSETYFKPEIDGNTYAVDLVKQIQNLNTGQYLDEDLQNSSKTNFCVGVAGYPEKHMEAPSLDSDLHFLKKKIEAGASYIITQMFFDNSKFFNFVKKCRDIGIKVPIIPGLKPISTKKQLNLLPHRFNVDLPEILIKEIIKCKDNEQVRQVGIEWSIAQCKALKESPEVPAIHFYSMGKSDNINAVASEVF